MTDITLPSPGAAVQWKRLERYLRVVMVLLLLSAISMCLVSSKTEERCDVRPGPFSSGLNLGFQQSDCECSSFFHFAEACQMAEPEKSRRF